MTEEEAQATIRSSRQRMAELAELMAPLRTEANFCAARAIQTGRPAFRLRMQEAQRELGALYKEQRLHLARWWQAEEALRQIKGTVMIDDREASWFSLDYPGSRDYVNQLLPPLRTVDDVA